MPAGVERRLSGGGGCGQRACEAGEGRATYLAKWVMPASVFLRRAARMLRSTAVSSGFFAICLWSQCGVVVCSVVRTRRLGGL